MIPTLIHPVTHPLDTTGVNTPPQLEPRVDTLSLSGNKISHVDLNFLSGWPSLEELDLSSNGLRALSNKQSTPKNPDFKPVYNLKRLDISRNALHVIHPYVFAGRISQNSSPVRILHNCTISDLNTKLTQQRFWQGNGPFLDDSDNILLLYLVQNME